MADGRTVAAGVEDGLRGEPCSTVTVTLPVSDRMAACADAAEIMLNVRYTLRHSRGLLDAGTVVAYDQMAVREYDTEAAYEARLEEDFTDETYRNYMRMPISTTWKEMTGGRSSARVTDGWRDL